jgi:hypothetical protein
MKAKARYSQEQKVIIMMSKKKHTMSLEEFKEKN